MGKTFKQSSHFSPEGVVFLWTGFSSVFEVKHQKLVNSQSLPHFIFEFLIKRFTCFGYFGSPSFVDWLKRLMQIITFGLTDRLFHLQPVNIGHRCDPNLAHCTVSVFLMMYVIHLTCSVWTRGQDYMSNCTSTKCCPPLVLL